MRLPCLGRTINYIEGWKEIVATPEGGDDRQPPGRPVHVVEQQIAFPKDQGRLYDGIGKADAFSMSSTRPLPLK